MATQRQARSRSRASRSRPGRARPPVRQTAPRVAGPDPAELQQRLGNRGTQAFLAENAYTRPPLGRAEPPIVEPETMGGASYSEARAGVPGTNPQSETNTAAIANVSPVASTDRQISTSPQSIATVVSTSELMEAAELIEPAETTTAYQDDTDVSMPSVTPQTDSAEEEEIASVESREAQATAMAATDTSVAPTESTANTSAPPQPDGAPTATGATAPSGELPVTAGNGEVAAEGGEAQREEPEVPAAPNPREAIAPAISAVRNRASGERQHRPPSVPVASAQAAGQDPQTEQTRMAARQTVQNLDAGQEDTEEIKREEFRAKLRQAIRDATPEPNSESEADRVINTGAADASNTLRGELATQRDAAAGPLESAASTEVPPSALPAPPNTDLELEQVGEPPAPVSAAPVVPAPLPPERLDYSSDRGSTDQMMAENNVSEQQLANSNEPSFGSALETRATAEEHEASVATRYRESESNVRSQAQAGGQQALTQGLTEMHGGRTTQIGMVIGQQTGTMSKNAAERQRITTTINGIKEKTQTDVTKILDDMETEAGTIFEAGLKLAEEVYADTFEEAKGGIGTWLTNWGDDWEDVIENALKTARREYFSQVDVAIDNVADLVERKLAQAKQRVTDGLTEVQRFVDELDDSVKQFGEDALNTVTADFDAMRSEIDQRRDGLINKLAQQYKESYERMSAMEEQLREENKSLWQRVYDATVGVIQQIIAFKDMLLGILARAAAVVESIIQDPIGFLGNLISGIKAGLDLFFGNIVGHLQRGLLGWLFGALEGAGIQIPDSFDFKGILSLIMQVLGLTYANIRKRAVRILGEDMVSRLEQVAEIFKVLFTEGPAGLWRMLMEQLSGIKDMLLEEIRSFVISEIIEAGVKWLIGLLNPAAAFIKACIMIYDIVIFFIERGSQIIELVNAIINSLAAIVSGNIQAMAQAVEGALARILPIAISFLAALLGLGGISGKIREIIEKIQEPVNTAIDWVIGKAVQLARAAGDLVAGALGGRDQDAVGDEGGGAGALSDDLVGISEDFTGQDNSSHRLSIGAGEGHELTVASRPMSYTQFINTIEPGDDQAKKAAKSAASQIVTEFYRRRNEKYPDGIDESQRRQMLEEKRRDLDDILGRLWVQTDILFGDQEDIPTGDTEAEAIPIDWYKPLHDRNLYPRIELMGNDGERFWFDIYDSRQTLTHPIQPGLTITLGIDRGRYEVREGKSLLRGREGRGTKTDQFRYLLGLFEADLEGLHADHVLDLNFGGEDDFANIWPLDSGANTSAGARQNSQIVTYRDSKSGQVRSVAAGHPDMVGKHFKIEKVGI